MGGHVLRRLKRGWGDTEAEGAAGKRGRQGRQGSGCATPGIQQGALMKGCRMMEGVGGDERAVIRLATVDNISYQNLIIGCISWVCGWCLGCVPIGMPCIVLHSELDGSYSQSDGFGHTSHISLLVASNIPWALPLSMTTHRCIRRQKNGRLSGRNRRIRRREIHLKQGRRGRDVRS